MAKRKPGRTTVSPGGLIKKSFWFHPEEVRVLRKAAYEQEISQAELVRTAVRRYFGMPDEANEDDESSPGGVSSRPEDRS
ncbi:MAG: hypothetical protein GY725_10890 [bacterium]|nr:hypothetical protein [bacterium]